MFLLLPIICCTQQFGSTLKIDVDFEVKTDFVVLATAFFYRPYLSKYSIKQRPSFLLNSSRGPPFYSPIVIGPVITFSIKGKLPIKG